MGFFDKLKAGLQKTKNAVFGQLNAVMKNFRKGLSRIGGKKVEQLLDYEQGLDGLPRSDVLKFMLEGHCSVVIRPSGTEPKMKAYISVSEKDAQTAQLSEQKIMQQLESCFV